MKVGSLFSGVGGFDLGLERAGHEVVWQVEFDKQCRSVLRRHWPKAQLHEDVNDVGSDELARVDLICGGFPCQDLSVAGNRAGLDGERSGLWFQFKRIVAELAPTWVLIENVPGLFTSNAGADFEIVKTGLAELGYVGAWRVLDSQHFGVAQRRRRVFLLAVRDLGAGRPHEVLDLAEGLSGHPAPSVAAGARAASRVASGFGVAGPVGAGCSRLTTDEVANGASVVAMDYASYSQGVNARYKPQIEEDAESVSTLLAQGPSLVFRKAQKAHDPEDCERWEDADVANTLSGHGTTADAVAFNIYPASGQGADLEASETDRACAVTAVAGERGTERGTRVVQHAVPRRLTPTECERLQGFPEIKETAIFQVWNWPDRQAARVNAGHPCPKSPSSAAPVATERLQPDARLAEPHSPTSHLGPEPPVVADVHIDCERNGVEIHSHGKLIWSASDAGTQSESPLPMGHAGFVRLAVGTMRTLERGTTTGGAGSQPKRGLSSPLRSGGIRADVCGREIAALASDADLLTEAVSGLSRSTTSEAGESSPTSAQTWAIFCSCVVRAISGFTPDATPTGSSFSFALTLHSGWTRYADDGTELADGPRYRMMGNAVTVSVAEWIGRRLKETE